MKYKHPGEVIQELYLTPQGLSVEQAAKELGVSWSYLYALLNGAMRVDAKIALKIEAKSEISAKALLSQQVEYDLFKARVLVTE